MLMSKKWRVGGLIIVQCAVLSIVTACATHAAENKKDAGPEKVISEAELQGQVMAFADRYWSIMNSAGIEYVNRSPSADDIRIVRAQLVYSAAGAFTIAAGPKPVAAFLDMVVMVTLGRMVFEQHYAKLHGDEVAPIVDGFQKAEADIWDLARSILTAGQQKKLMDLIEAFRRDNPEVVVFSNVRFSEFEKFRGISDGSGEKSSGGLFKSVADATQQVEETRLLAERAMYLGSRLPLMTGPFANVWASQLVRNPDVNPVLSDLNRMAAVSQRMAIVAEKLPDDIAKERQATIDQLVDRISIERQDTIKQVFDGLAQERRRTIQEFLAEEERMRGLLTELKLTLDSGNDLLGSTHNLVENLNLSATDAGGAAPAKPFDINDYKSTLQEASNTIVQLHGLVKTVDQMGLDKTLPKMMTAVEKIGQQGETWVLQAFMLGVVLIFVLLLGAVFAMILYRYMVSKMFSEEQK